MKKNYFYSLFAALMLFVAMPASAQLNSIQELFGTWQFEAQLEVVDQSKADLFSGNCEVTITNGEGSFPVKMINFAGCDKEKSLNSVDLERGAIMNLNPNTPPLWDGLFMANGNGDYPYSSDEDKRYSSVEFIYDAATKTITYPDFTVVTCDHPNSAATIVAKFTNVKLTLKEAEKIEFADIAGEWDYAPYYSTEGSVVPSVFKLTLAANDDASTSDLVEYNATIAFEGYNDVVLPATFDGLVLNIAFDENNCYLDSEQKIRFGLPAKTADDPNIFAKSGVIDFRYNKTTLMYQGESIVIRKEGTQTVEEEGVEVERPAAPLVQTLRGGTLYRKDPNAYDWSGKYTLSVSEDGLLHYDESVTFPSYDVTIESNNGEYIITEFLGFEIPQNYCRNLEDGDDANSININVEITAYGPSVLLQQIGDELKYFVITGVNEAKTVALTLQEDGTIALGDFILQIWTYTPSAMDKIARFSGATLVKQGADTAIDNVVVENNAVKGIYDMLGRKVDVITAPGIYIVDGKKVLVK